MFNKIGKFFEGKPSRLELVEEELKDLKKFILGKPKKADLESVMDFYHSTLIYGSSAYGVDRSISLNEKVEALAEHLKIRFEKTYEKPSEVVVEKIPVKRKRRRKRKK